MQNSSAPGECCSSLPGGSGQPFDSSVGTEAQLAAAAAVVGVAETVECAAVVVEDTPVVDDISAAAGVCLRT